MKFDITEPMVRKILATVDAGLVCGMGEPEPGKMCVEAAISYALGETHGDRPSCVDHVVRVAKIRLNDAPWSSNASRAKGMRRVAIAQLGSKNTIDSAKFSALLAEYTIREIVPIALRSAARLNPTHNAALEAEARQCEENGTESAARSAARSAESAARSAAESAKSAAWSAARFAKSAAWSAAEYAAWSAVRSARSAESAAESAAWSARSAESAAESAAEYAAWSAESAARSARSAAWSAAESAEPAAEIDRILSLSASLMVRALQECGSPGSEWLWLTDELPVPS